RSLAARAIELTNESRLDEAASLAGQARIAAIECDDLIGLARAADASGVIARVRGDVTAAIDYATEALALAEVTHDKTTLARAWSDLGRIQIDLLHDTEAAREAYERGIAI